MGQGPCRREILRRTLLYHDGAIIVALARPFLLGGFWPRAAQEARGRGSERASLVPGTDGSLVTSSPEFFLGGLAPLLAGLFLLRRRNNLSCPRARAEARRGAGRG